VPTVSVIIPTYNCAEYLPASVDSMLGQRIPDDVTSEVIVVDDGSSDDTASVLAAYRDRITVVRGAHGGYAAARNLGLAHAHGTWIAFHDADDVAHPDRLAFQLEQLRREPAFAAVFCDGARMDGGQRLVPPAVARACAGRALTSDDVFAGFPVYFQAALVPRAAFEATGPFDETLRIHADMDYGYRLFPRCQALFVDRVVFQYRWHASNVTGDRLRGREEIARVLERRYAAGDQGGAALRKVRARLARQWYQIARRRFRLEQPAAGREALARAIALRPFHPRYRLLGLLHPR